MSDHLLILRLSGDFYTKARKTRMRFFRRLVANLEAALKAHGVNDVAEWQGAGLQSPIRWFDSSREHHLHPPDLTETQPWPRVSSSAPSPT